MENDAMITLLAKPYIGFLSGACSWQDLMQAGRLGVLRAQKTYVPEKGPWFNWAKFYIKGEIRKLLELDNPFQRLASLDAPLKDADVPLVETILDDSDIDEITNIDELCERVRELVAAIPKDEWRDTINMIDLEGFSVCEYASAMGLDKKTVIRNRNSAFRCLRRDPRTRLLYGLLAN